MVFSEPNLDLSKVLMEVVEGWRNQRLSLADWSLEFQAADSADELRATSDDIKEKTTFLSKAAKSKSPSKKRQEDDEVIETDFVILGWRGEPYRRTLPDEGVWNLKTKLLWASKRAWSLGRLQGLKLKLKA